MEIYGLIGNPVEHSLSPVIHNTISGEMNIEAQYRLYKIEDSLGENLKRLYDEGAAGLNVTVPYKSQIMEYLCGTDPLAQAIGAVNTLKRTDSGYYGYNTAIEGLRREIKEEGISLKGRDCIVLGAGGAARAASFMLLTEKAGSITIINRSVDKAMAIASGLKSFWNDNLSMGEETGDCPEIRVLPTEVAGKLEGSGYIAIQCTSVGLKPDSNRAVIESPEFYKRLSYGIDVVYSPGMTRFMQLCRENGAGYVNGLKMLLYQAVYAYELWHGVSLEREVIDKAYQALFNACMKNIVLIGCMGAGKSSVGRILAERLGYEYADTDEMIVSREGRSINDIFSESGEEYFRELETGVVKELSESNESRRLVLSVGGGLPVRECNRSYLKKIGTVVYLRADEETLAGRIRNASDRPLLNDTKTAGKEESTDRSARGADFEEKKRRIRKLLEYRGKIYEDTSDFIIDTVGLSLNEVVSEGERVL